MGEIRDMLRQLTNAVGLRLENPVAPPHVKPKENLSDDFEEI